MCNENSLSFMSFWSINDELKLDNLKAQLNELKTAGLSGVVFHPRYYPNKPEYLGTEYMRIVNELILYAKSIQMDFWIYDENGWPSGSANGKVLEQNPDFMSQWISILSADQYLGVDTEILFSFRLEDELVYRADSKKGELYHLIRITENAVSSLDSKAAQAFIEITHEGYKKSLSEEAFQYVAGFFSDEVHFPLRNQKEDSLNSIPWIDDLIDKYMAIYNEDIIPKLPLLFIDGDGYQRFRAEFWELLTDAISDAFYKPINQWCVNNSKKFTAHLKGEEHPFFQLKYSGSCLQVLKNINLPAIDALERYPGNNYYPRMLYSIAAQFGNGDCLCECMAGCGWGTTPEDFTNYILWLASHGINNYVLHLNQLRLKSSGIHDWPPSTPCHINWKEAFPVMLEAIKNKANMLPDLNKTAELLIVTPTRGVMAQFKMCYTENMNEHDGSNIPHTESGRITREFLHLVESCHKDGIHYELTEERLMEEQGIIEPGYLKLGKRRYNKILMPRGCKWSDTGNELLLELKNAGVQIMYQKPLTPAKTMGTDNNTHDSIIPLQSGWEASTPKSNVLALEFEEVGVGKLQANFRMESSLEIQSLELVCYDNIRRTSINGQQLTGIFNSNDNAYVYAIARETITSDTCLIELEGCENGLTHLQDEANPVALIRGYFNVFSESNFVENGVRGIKTKGPFTIKACTKLNPNDLVSTGLPFCRMPVRLAKIIRLPDDLGEIRIKLNGVLADAAKVYVDGVELGWCWAQKWLSQESIVLDRGTHEVSVDIIPSTYNVFGPHRHIDGDRHLVSPDQYLGIKNFADRCDAPDNTFDDYWNFVRFGINGDVVLVKV